MMELGQTLCRPGVPLCESCPVAGFCKTMEPERLPVKKKTPEITEITEHAIWLRDADGNILLHCESGSRRNGLWKLPLRSGDFCSAFPQLFENTYPITRYKVRLKIHAAENCPPEKGDEWIGPDRLEQPVVLQIVVHDPGELPAERGGARGIGRRGPVAIGRQGTPGRPGQRTIAPLRSGIARP